MQMNIAGVRDRQNWAIYLAFAALLMSLIACSRSTTSNAAAPDNNDPWKNERQYPPLVFNSSAWLDCSISSSANGRQAMTTTSGQGFTFDATMLPIEKSKLQLIGQSGMKYKFDSFPVAAVKARFTGLGDGTITEMKTEVEVASLASRNRTARGRPSTSQPPILPRTQPTLSSPECSSEPVIPSVFHSACPSAAFKMEAVPSFLLAPRRRPLCSVRM